MSTVQICSAHVVRKSQTNLIKMKQLDIVMSSPAFVWDPNLTLTHVIFDLNPCRSHKPRKTDRQTDRQTENSLETPKSDVQALQ